MTNKGFWTMMGIGLAGLLVMFFLAAESFGADLSSPFLETGVRYQLSDVDDPPNINSRRMTVELQPDGIYYEGWSGEVWFKIWFDQHQDFVFFTDSGVEWAFEVTGPERTFAFPMESHNLNWFPQPNGSYALYHSSKKWNHHFDDGDVDAYLTGKFSHMYAPYAYDANDDSALMQVSVGDGWFVMSYPEDWNPVLPVVVDPQFGNVNIGGSNTDQGTYLEVSGYSYSGDNGADVDSFGFYGGYTSAREYWYTWYSGATPTTRSEVDSITGLIEAGAGAATPTGGDAGFHQWDLTGNSATVSSGSKYWPGICNSGDLVVYYDVGSSGDSYYIQASGALPPASPSWEGNEDYLLSVYLVTSGGTSGGGGVSRSDLYKRSLYIGDLYH